MSEAGLWFSRFAAGGEGWLPLVALGSTACVLVAMGAAPETASLVGPAPSAQESGAEVAALGPLPAATATETASVK